MTRQPKRLSSIDRRQFLGGMAAGAATVFAPSVLSAQSREKVTLAYGSTGYTWAVPYVAEVTGLWKAANIELATPTFESGRDAMQALLTGTADFSTTTDTPFVFAGLNGLRPLAVVNFSRYSRDMKIAVRADSGIDPNVPASLRGRKIATRVGTSGQYLLAKYLELAGLTAQDVTTVDLAPSNMGTALTRGDIDGFAWSSQSVAIAQKQSGGKVAEMTLDGIETYFQSHQLLLTTERVLKEKPELVATAVKILLEAEARIGADPKWPELIAERIKTPAADIAEATSTFTFKVGFDDRFVADLVSQAEWAIAAGIGKKPSGDLRTLFRNLVAEGPTKALRPDRVTLA